MAFKDFPDNNEGRIERRKFYESEEGLALIESWRRNGLTVEKIAEDCIGVSKFTFQKWRKESEPMRKAMDVAIEICNANVEKTLYNKAVGYYYDEDIYELIEGELRLSKRYHRYMPPDTKATLAWLYNHLPNKYRSIQEPIENTQYQDTVKNILVAMKQVAENGQEQTITSIEMIEG